MVLGRITVRNVWVYLRLFVVVQGKYLYMDLDQENLSLIDPHDLTVLNVQPIKSIRVWGVCRDNGR